MQTCVITGLDGLKRSVILVDITPVAVVIGVASSESIAYETFIPSKYRDFSELFRDFLRIDPGLTAHCQECYISMPENEGIIPGYPWELNLSLLEHQFSHFAFDVVDRELCLALLPEFSLGESFINLAQKSPDNLSKFSFGTASYGAVSSDFSVTLTRVDPSKAFNALPSVGFDTDFSKVSVTSIHPEMQIYLNHISSQFGEEAISVQRFFSPKGLTCWYETLYQQKGFLRQLELAQLKEPLVVQSGAPSDIAPLQINKPPRLSIEDLQVDILSNPYDPTPEDNFSPVSRAPRMFSDSGMASRTSSYFQTLSWSTLLSYAEQEAQENALSPILVNGIVIPTEIVNLAHSTLDSWVTLFGETLAQLVILMNMPGGIFMVGSFFQKLSGILPQGSFGSVFVKGTQEVNPDWSPQCLLVSMDCPTFPYLVYLAKISS